MKAAQILIAGFGGQGVLFTGKFLAYAGLTADMNVSWLPSYGPEMRGGTANCSVILSESVVGSPIVSHPDVLIAMNLPSLDKYENDTVSGGDIFYDSSLIARPVTRADANIYGIPCTSMASDNGLDGLANMIMLGHVLARTGLMTLEEADKVLTKVVSAKHADRLEKNRRAIAMGYNF